MKAMITLLLTLATFSTFAATIELQNNSLKPEIANFLKKELVKCTLDAGNEVFYVENIKTKSIRVDNGIVDVEYTIDITYDAVRNDVLTNTLKVVVMDYDFNNYKNYEERLTMNIVYDQNNFCN
jgi:hypothetical protein